VRLPNGGTIYGVPICGMLLILVSVVTRIYASRSTGPRWENRLPRFGDCSEIGGEFVRTFYVRTEQGLSGQSSPIPQSVPQDGSPCTTSAGLGSPRGR
jgi:hypothetical protein